MSVAIDLISGILQPVLPVLAAGGMTKGLLSLAAFLGWISKDSGTYTVICSFADGIFYFLPIFLGLTAARKFKINEFVGAAIGAALCFPAMVNIGATAEALGSVLAGTPFEMSYYATFLGLPVIMPQVRLHIECHPRGSRCLVSLRFSTRSSRPRLPPLCASSWFPWLRCL